MNNPQNEKNAEAICPNLGLPSDPLTAMSYPSSQNYCRHVTPAAAPGAAHQRKFCLASPFNKCPLYAARSTKPMPAQYLAEPVIVRKKASIPYYVIIGFFVLAVLTAVIWVVITRLLPSGLNRTPAAALPAPSKPATAVSTIIVITNTPQLAPAFNPSPAFTPKPAQPHVLEMPIGSQRQFLLHRVLEGESMNLLAITYRTSADAIRAANYNLPATLWVNTVIIIPLDQTEADGIFPMTVYAVETEGTSLSALAQEMGVSLDALCNINDLPDDYLLKPGEWVIIPAAPEAP